MNENAEIVKLWENRTYLAYSKLGPQDISHLLWCWQWFLEERMFEDDCLPKEGPARWKEVLRRQDLTLAWLSMAARQNGLDGRAIRTAIHLCQSLMSMCQQLGLSDLLAVRGRNGKIIPYPIDASRFCPPNLCTTVWSLRRKLLDKAWNKLPSGATEDDRQRISAALPSDKELETFSEGSNVIDELKAIYNLKIIESGGGDGAAAGRSDVAQGEEQNEQASPAGTAEPAKPEPKGSGRGPCFLTVRLPFFLLGTDAVDDPDRAAEPNLTHEKKSNAFYEVDSKTIGEAILETFTYGKPAPGIHGDPLAPVGSVEGFRKFVEGVCQPIFGLVNAADLNIQERVLCRDQIGVLVQTDSMSGMNLGPRLELLLDLYRQAHRWEPLVRDELAVVHGRGRGVYLWWTWGSVHPEEPTADLDERFYFYKVASVDVAARIRGAFSRDHGDDIRFGYTAGEALNIDEAVRANDCIAEYRRRECQGEDKDFFWQARQWESHLPVRQQPVLADDKTNGNDLEQVVAAPQTSGRNGQDGKGDMGPLSQEAEDYEQMKRPHLVWSIDRWENAISELNPGIVAGDTDHVHKNMKKYSFEKISNQISLAMEHRGISSQPVEEFLEQARAVDAGFKSKGENLWFGPAFGAVSRLKKQLALESIGLRPGQQGLSAGGAAPAVAPVGRSSSCGPPTHPEDATANAPQAPRTVADRQQTDDQSPPAKKPDPPIERNAGIPPYGRAIARVLKDAPKSWQRLCGENFSNAQKKALPLLVQTGLMEARVEARARMQGRPQAVRLLAIVSGNFRSKLLDEVLRAVPDWLTPDGAAADKCVFHFDFLEVRLTENGGLAKDGLADSSYPILWALMQGRVPHTSAAEVSDVVGIEKSDVELMEAFDGQVSSFLQFAPYVPSTVSDSHVCSLAQGDSPSRIEEIIEEEDGQFMRQDVTRFSAIQKEVYNAVTRGDLPRVLDVLESDLRYWGDTAKEHLLGLFHDYEIDGHHMFGPGILPFWLGRPIAGALEAFEMLEITRGEDCAGVFARRLDPFFDERQRFAELCGSFTGMPEDGEYARFCGNVCDERKELKKLAHTTADYVRLFRCQLASPRDPASKPEATVPATEKHPDDGKDRQIDTPDPKGFVVAPSDVKAYLPAARIIDSHWPIPPLPKVANRNKALLKVLDDHPDIWRWRPTDDERKTYKLKNCKLMVHLGRWQHYINSQKTRLDDGFRAVAAKETWRCLKCRKGFVLAPDQANCPFCGSSNVERVILRTGK